MRPSAKLANKKQIVSNLKAVKGAVKNTFKSKK